MTRLKARKRSRATPKAPSTSGVTRREAVHESITEHEQRAVPREDASMRCVRGRQLCARSMSGRPARAADVEVELIAGDAAEKPEQDD